MTRQTRWVRWRIRLRIVLSDSRDLWRYRPVSPALVLLAVVLSLAILSHYRRFVIQAGVSLYHANALVWLKVMGYGVVPSVLAILGFHLSALVVDNTRKRRLWRASFILIALIGAVAVGIVEHKGDVEHRAEVSDLQGRIDAVGSNNDSLLHQLLAEQTTPATEESRRRKILAFLTNEYITSHTSVSAGILAGTEQPPSDWLNQHLKELGEKWTVEEPPKQQAQVITAPPAVNLGNLKTRCIDLAQELQRVTKSRNDALQKYYPQPPSGDSYREWMYYNERAFEAELSKVRTLQDELATLHYQDDMLNQRLSSISDCQKIRLGEPPTTPQNAFICIDAFDMQIISERLLSLANQIPQQ